jgi:hypothetical protein
VIDPSIGRLEGARDRMDFERVNVSEKVPTIRGIDRAAPLIVGGGGGSGTRVIALILLRMRFFLGRDRNSAEDNLLFTLLFKRPRWRARADRSEIDRALAVLERGILDGCRAGDAGMLFAGARDFVLNNREYRLPRRLLWAARRMRNAYRRPSHDGHAAGWGWKEPNSHIYLEDLARRFPAMRYIHVIRHGLDMAFSGNQAQLDNWGSLFGLDKGMSDSPAQRSLRYWIRSNQAVLRKGGELLQERFLVMRFDDLCDRPREEIKRLAAFVRVPINQEELDSLASIPQSPASRGRYRHRDLSIFDPESLQAVETLGFRVRAREEVAA